MELDDARAARILFHAFLEGQTLKLSYLTDQIERVLSVAHQQALDVVELLTEQGLVEVHRNAAGARIGATILSKGIELYGKHNYNTTDPTYFYRRVRRIRPPRRGRL